MVDEQKITEYEPTTTEKKLLEVMLNPENRNLNVTEICSLAECGRTVYYQSFKKPEFKELLKKAGKELTIQAVVPMVHAFIKAGLDGSFQHGKTILEMAEIYSEKKDINAKIDGNLEFKWKE